MRFFLVPALLLAACSPSVPQGETAPGAPPGNQRTEEEPRTSSASIEDASEPRPAASEGTSSPSEDKADDDDGRPPGLQMGGGLMARIHDCDDATQCDGVLDAAREKAIAAAVQGVAGACGKGPWPAGKTVVIHVRLPSFGETCWTKVVGRDAQAPLGSCVATELEKALDDEALLVSRPPDCASLEIRIDGTGHKRPRVRIDTSKNLTR